MTSVIESSTSFVSLKDSLSWNNNKKGNGGRRRGIFQNRIVLNSMLDRMGLNLSLIKKTNTDEEQRTRQRRKMKRITVLIIITCIISILLSLIVICLEIFNGVNMKTLYSYYTSSSNTSTSTIATALICVAFIFPFIINPYVIYQRRKLNKLPTLMNVMNEIRIEANCLSIQNDRLHYENNQLHHEVKRLKEAEEKLNAIVTKSGYDMNRFIALVQENGQIQRQMVKLQKAKELQQLLTIIMQSDTNHDNIISDAELEILMLRSHLLSAYDTSKIRTLFQLAGISQNSVSSTQLYRDIASDTYMDDMDDNFYHISDIFTCINEDYVVKQTSSS